MAALAATNTAHDGRDAAGVASAGAVGSVMAEASSRERTRVERASVAARARSVTTSTIEGSPRMTSTTRLQSPFEPRPTLQVWRDGPTLWNEWARAALLERRTVLIDRPLDDGMAAQAASELTLLTEAGDEPVDLRIDSEGGTIGGALTLVDVVDVLGASVRATCVGRADGPALAVLAVADRRAAAPHARLRWGAGESDELVGRASDIVHLAEVRAREVEQIADRVARCTRLTADEVRERLDRRAYLRVEEALALGVIDEVLAPEARVVGFPRRVGFDR
jgi:ATP-dependent Clp protease protease subunit